MDALNSDLVISAVQLNLVPKMPFILINPLFSNADQSKVANKIKELKEIKQKELFKKNIEAMMDERLFKIEYSLKTKEEALTMMCAVMEQKKFVDASFLANVREREAMSSTAFGRIAIPHAIKMNAKKTGMFVLINEKGIKWNELTVNLVLLISVSKDDRILFHDVFDSLAAILTEEKNVSQILTAADYQEFVDLLVECY